MSTAYNHLPPLPKIQAIEGYEPVHNNSTRFDIIHEHTDTDGVLIREVSISDISDESTDRQNMQAKVAGYDEWVRQHPDWSGPTVKSDGRDGARLICNNPVSEEMYSAMPALASWRTHLVPRAVALYSLQYPEERHLPNGVEIDDPTRSIFTNSLDAIGIRTRAKVMSRLAAHYINQEGITNWTSLACGAAVPVFNAIQDNADKIHQINLKLIDFDPSALDFACDVAQHRGLEEGNDFELMNRNLLKYLVATDKLVQELGEESMELVDALGIFEYFDKKPSTKFLANAYKLVKPGGAIVAANMLHPRPELDFNQRVIGWPKIYPRSIDEVKDIIREAGIDFRCVTVTIPSDGIYAVFEIKK